VQAWWGAALPASGNPCTLALIQAGLADTFTNAGAYGVVMMDAGGSAPLYPTFTK